MTPRSGHSECFEQIDVSGFGDMPRTKFVPGPCSHRHVVPVDSVVTGETLTWLCLCCDHQLDARPVPG